MALAMPGFLESRTARRIGVVAIGAAATIGTYVWLLYHSGSPRGDVSDYLRGPYVAWHVAVVAVILGLGAIWAGWLGFPLLGAVVETTALVGSWSTTAATDRTSNSAWPIGAVLIGWVCLGGSLLLGSIVMQIRLVVHERRERAAAEMARMQARAAAEEASRIAAQQAALAAAQQLAREAAALRAAEAVRQFEAERTAREAQRASRVKVAKVFAASSKTALTSARGRARSNKKAG